MSTFSLPSQTFYLAGDQPQNRSEDPCLEQPGQEIGAGELLDRIVLVDLVGNSELEDADRAASEDRGEVGDHREQDQADGTRNDPWNDEESNRVETH